ncbi:unnamed protein product [Ostreobium quekettii]|uniref:Band 7 domain-containing protein n=1 Tax=Ostreobium quekettii TaxID=121088 RepID=A0A8S1J6W0_9CHLO|nr:unnamed protein product [Ostreobium quekettii]|eukprot:evm.model.scf_462.7 EVM.evm.TU.scf_462.7   scf_462:46844-52232(-)
MQRNEAEAECDAKAPLLPAEGPGAPHRVADGADAHEAIPFLDSPSYTVLLQTGLLTARFRKPNLESLDLMPANTSKSKNFCSRTAMCLMIPLLGGCWYDAMNMHFFVPAGCVQRLQDGKGEYHLAGPGHHRVMGYFWTRVGVPTRIVDGVQHGDRTVVVVEQGSVGLAWDLGQPMLLPPGVHEWRSETLRFERCISLDNPVIAVGPYTLVTVDDGYAAITLNNGKLTILPGGSVHFLDHRNWKFQKFITLKMQTDNLEKIMATTADNVIVAVTSTVNWRIIDVETASLMAIKTLYVGEREGSHAADIKKLQNDIMKQAEASLASFIGSVNYSDTFHVAAAAQAAASTSVGVPVPGQEKHADISDNPIFDKKMMNSAVHHANEVTKLYGVEIISINIISANPVDNKLTVALSSGAVASAEALQSETAARANAKAQLIEAKTAAANRLKEAEAEADALRMEARGAADATLIKAKAEAEAERLRAAGAKDAADLLASSDVAVDLAKMDKAGVVMGDRSKFFFGQDPGYFAKIMLREVE